MASIGQIEILLQMQTARFTAAAKEVSNRIGGMERNFGRSFSRIDRNVGTVVRGLKTLAIAAGVAAGPTAMLALVRSSSSAVDALGKSADRIGITTQALAGFQLAAELGGVEINTLQKTLQNMTSRVSEATFGIGEGKRALEQLGISAQVLATLPVDKQFERIMEGLAGVTNASERVQIAMDLFGARGIEVLNLLGTNWQRAREDAEAFGLAVTRIEARQIEEANDQLTRVQKTIQGIGNQLAIQAAGPIKGIGIAFENLGRSIVADLKGSFDDSAGAAERWARATTEGIIVVINAIALFKAAWDGIQAVWKLVQATFIEFVVIPINEALVAIGEQLAKLPNFLGGARFGAALEQNKTILAETEQQLVDIQTELLMLGDPTVNFTRRLDEAREAADKLRAGLEKIISLRAFEAPSALGGAGAGGEAAPAGEFIGKIPSEEAGFEKLASFRQFVIREQLDLVNEQLRILDESLFAQTDKISEALTARAELERELEEQRHNTSLGRLFELIDAKIIAEEEGFARLEELKAQHEARMTAIERANLTARQQFEKQSLGQKIATMAGLFAQATAIAAQHDKKMFKLHKIASIADAIVSTAKGVARALSMGPAGIPLAAVIAAAGAIQINTIRNTEFGGGAAAATPVFAASPATGLPETGGVEAVAEALRGEPQREININVRGTDVFSAENIRDFLAPALEDAISDGAIKINVAIA